MNGDLISRQDVIELIDRCRFKSRRGARKVRGLNFADGVEDGYLRIRSEVSLMPSVQPKPLTDKEQRTFLRAMEREEKVCKHVDNVYNSSYEDSLVRTCHEITRKVKGALWT